MRAIEILLVEDSPTDRLIAVEALQQARILNSLNVVENGVEAMAYLRREGKYAGAIRPDLILLDLNLPKKDGREVLAEVKADPFLKFIPVVILTTSKADEDIVRSYGANANSYITKPVDFQRFTEALRSLENYWFEVVTLPTEAAIQRVAKIEPQSSKSRKLDIGSTVHVLLAEDNPTDVLLIREALCDSPLVKFSITHVDRLADLRTKLDKGEYDVVLIDLGLPDSQGLETYRSVKAYAGGLPIIVLTGADDEVMGIAALREGAQEYLVKGQLSESSLARVLRYAIEKKGIEDRLRQSQKMEAIGQLSAGVAHDFNNILTVIRGRAELLMMHPEALDEAMLNSCQEIQSAAARAASLTRQLLTFSRQQVMRAQALDLNEAVGNTAKMLRRVLGEHLRVELQLTSGRLMVEADLGMMEQVVLNLAVNARDAMVGGGKLTLRTSEVELSPEDSNRHVDAYAGHFRKLTVSDTGCGMTPQVVARIFEPFFTTKDVGKGTGLGLATVLGVVQQHRGWVEVSSRVGIGTTFDVFLPASAYTPEIEEPVVRDKKTEGGNETILLVEDEEAVRMMAKIMLELKGYRVVEAASGVDAVGVWQEHRQDIRLLLTDMVMPDGKTGRELAEELTALNPDLKVLYSSGYSEDFIKEGFELKQGVNFLRKPYEMDELIQTVRTCLEAP